MEFLTQVFHDHVIFDSRVTSGIQCTFNSNYCNIKPFREIQYQFWSPCKGLVCDNYGLNVHYPLIHDTDYCVYGHREIKVIVTDLDIVFQQGGCSVSSADIERCYQQNQTTMNFTVNSDSYSLDFASMSAKTFERLQNLSNVSFCLLYKVPHDLWVFLESNFKMHDESNDLNMIKYAVFSLSFHSEMSQVNQRTKAERKVRRVLK